MDLPGLEELGLEEPPGRLSGVLLGVLTGPVEADVGEDDPGSWAEVSVGREGRAVAVVPGSGVVPG